MIADLHIHSRFSRACSNAIDFENLVKWAKIKGLHLLGTGDFTHPIWFNEIKEKLSDNGKGFYIHTPTKFPFIITGEISLIYSQVGKENENSSRKGRRIHLVLFMPNIEIAEKVNSYFDKKGRRDYDGRPIFKISGYDFVKDLMEISSDIEIIPAHIWTPWFGVFGSMSGFDNLKECFKEQFENIHAIETGMSSDPEMNWRIKELEDKAIISFSDSHSFWPYRLGREATIFRNTDSYKVIIEQIRNNSFISTIETDPAYGKYHWDGHRTCGFSCPSEKTTQLKKICPKCNKELTIGVESRVEQLSSYPLGQKTKNSKPFYKILPLHEIISLAVNGNMQTKKVWEIYNSLIKDFGNELDILLNVSRDELLKNFDDKLVDLIIKNRKGEIKVNPGYDGVYGEASLGEKQATLF